MGQEQSTPSPSAAVNPTRQRGFGTGPRRQREPASSPALSKDSYFQFAQIGDVINPIFLSNAPASEATPANLPEAFNLADAFKSLLKKQSTGKGAGSGESRSESSLSESSGAEGEIGKYHREVKREEQEENVLHASSHPIRIKD
eukprot:Gregarina_sp_Poly_1__4555@NODE_2443_length_2129_cov_78_994665_g1551_i0_p1_GENE_NODE_2443_length_2129_cov_78_994665_g1551_i0NODE_2443_length_2129_cov_78_994665_g1551_i0_p1_ORF_typecomplete_len144_score27_39_NODE_2443_length_2129_cov_78_994665_g1551_i0475906